MGNRRQEHKKEIFEFYIQHQRPEEFSGDPLLFYTKERVSEYARSKALMRIQEGITKRALKIVEIQPPARILDLGMGCGYASAYLQMQHYDTVGIDLNRDFLSFYSIPELNPIQADMRQFAFRPETFDMILSISAVQWILAEKNFELRKKYCTQLVQSCHYLLKSDGKLIIQFYPKSDSAMKEFGGFIADLNLFKGNFIVDNPDRPKKRKIFLYLEKP